MNIFWIESAAAIEALEPEWVELYERSESAAPFQHPDWILPWWEIFGGGQVFSLAMRRQGRLTALAPMFLHVWQGRRPYASALPGIPTIRPFEALACGAPLISAPWSDSEGLFRPGTDFLFARDGAEMIHLLREVLSNATLARSLAVQGPETIRSRHTCAHRVDELLSITRQTEGLASSSRSA